jgi:2-amino-4-hydroxy-6-hydroxymethyldihydropteridine diphosphokinase
VVTIYLALGSNVGDRAANIAGAVEALPIHGIHVTKKSSLFESEPVQVRGGEWFLNAAVEAETNLSPREVMAALLEIEKSLGRNRTLATAPSALKEPRTIDLDILLFGSTVMNTSALQIPHPRMAERRFVLAPLAEIAPEAVHPGFKKTAAQLLAETRDSSEVRKI